MKIVIIFQIKIQEGDLNVGIMVNEQIYVNLIIVLIGIFLIIIKIQKDVCIENLFKYYLCCLIFILIIVLLLLECERCLIVNVEEQQKMMGLI